MRPLTTRSIVTPGSTRLSRSKLRISSADPVTRTTVAAISATTSRLRSRAVRTDVPVPDEPSRSAPLTRNVETDIAGMTPDTIAAKAHASTDAKSTRSLNRMSSTKGV